MGANAVGVAAPDTPARRFPVEGFKRGMETCDMDLVVENWTDDCLLRPLSPDKFKIRGKPNVRFIVRQVTGSCDVFKYTEEIYTHDTIYLLFRAEARGNHLDGVDFLRINEEGKCTEMFVMARPALPALLLVAKVFRRQARQGGLLRWLLATAFVKPLEWMELAVHPLRTRLQRAALEKAAGERR
jgi:hypothetical protein